ncbi:MAG: EscU/YscU/HrcU family type III secretion system export apparatus switch protein [Proteobacteria bacterium]|nr:EscU/YscU/HrcU family type III secretion system export apparatus switch protein [Pseudomonadota bacterium]
MAETETDKSEDATPYKLRKAREKGAVARSLDLGFFAALSAALGFLAVGGGAFAIAVAHGSAGVLASAGLLGRNPHALPALTQRLLAPVTMPLLTFAGALFLIALVLDFVQVGPVFSAAPLKPDFTRINPVQGFKRLFTARLLVEALKASLKFAIYAAIAWLVIRRMVRVHAMAMADPASLGTTLAGEVARLVMFFALAALAFAVLDQLYVRRTFARRMRMSRRERKREHREHEGEPRLKQRRKQLHAEFAKAVKALRAVREADMIITNPTHFAVALRYLADSPDAAPQVIARGSGDMARRIRAVAGIHGVPLISDPALARALYRFVRLDHEIPAQFYDAVAGHYRRRRASQKRGD